MILIDLDLKSIQNLVEDITMGQTGFGYIQDSQGHVLYAPQNEVVYLGHGRREWTCQMSHKGKRLQCHI